MFFLSSVQAMKIIAKSADFRILQRISIGNLQLCHVFATSSGPSTNLSNHTALRGKEMARLIHSVSRIRRVFGLHINMQTLDDRFSDRLEALNQDAKARLPARRLY